MHLRLSARPSAALLAGLAAALLACRSSPPGLAPSAQRAPTLDVAGFEPPFEPIPVARSFLAEHRVTRLSVHELEPGTTTARSSEITEYDASGAPVRRSTRSGHHAPVLVEEIAYAQVQGGAVPALPAAPGSPELVRKLVSLDPAGRVARIDARRVASSVTELHSYDAAGRLIRVAREERRVDDADDAGAATGATQYEELRTYASGRLARRTRGKVGAAPFETLDFSYDAGGRFAAWRGQKPGFGDDRYAFTYEPSGQLASMRFQEGPKLIYERRYTYDADGFLVRVERMSAVPALGSATFVLAYELADGSTRQTVAVTFPAPPRQKTDADVLAALRRVFPAAAAGAVRWGGDGDGEGDGGGGRVLESVTFQLPAAQLGAATEEQLQAQACALRKALGIAECDCERLELGGTLAGVTIVTFRPMLGC